MDRPLIFVLDTNVLSAILNSRPTPEVRQWIADTPGHLLFTTATSHAEIFSGIAIMPVGRRRDTLDAAARALFDQEFDGRVLPFDQAASTAFAEMLASRRRSGRPTSFADLTIAAIAKVAGASVVTRNLTDFADCGVPLIDPWHMLDKEG